MLGNGYAMFVGPAVVKYNANVTIEESEKGRLLLHRKLLIFKIFTLIM
jgi:hypothetical protein